MTVAWNGKEISYGKRNMTIHEFGRGQLVDGKKITLDQFAFIRD